MGERYIVTGAQLGIFQAMAKANKPDEIEKLVQTIIDDQHIGESTKNIKDDATILFNLDLFKEAENDGTKTKS
jgi:hypothetical protein